MKVKPIHLIKMVSPEGLVSPVCAEPPRALNLKRETWTLRLQAVTCEACRAKAEGR